MCLITNKKEVSIAKRDKTVFKWIISKNNNDNTWTGPIYSHVDFPFNEIVTAKDSHGKEIDHLQLHQNSFRPDDEYDMYIEEGMHSCRIRSLEFIYRHRKICIIPKGSEYCCGLHDEVVSTKIIVFSSCKEYFRYRWKKLLKKIS